MQITLRSLLLALAFVLSTAPVRAVAPVPAETPMEEVVAAAFRRAVAQYDFMLYQLRERDGLPRTFDQEKLVLSERDWTVGFFPGSLWYLFEATGDARWRKAAERYTALVAPHQHNRGTHDVGFMLYCSFGNGLRLTENAAYRDVLLNGAASLASRFNPKVGATKSWDWSTRWQFPVIIDNMMNLELLLWAARASGDAKFREMAVRHADTTLKNHFRPDASCFHVVDYDPQTGAVRERVTHQGAADNSVWARGQAWAIYGYTLMYRETREPRYLAQARATADFFMKHPRLPSDKIPFWDFDAPEIPRAPRDSSAAALTASALLELSAYVSEREGRRYRAFAEAQLRSLASPAYLATVGENGGFLLKRGTGNLPSGSEIDTPLNYGDYYFLEALLRCRALLAKN